MPFKNININEKSSIEGILVIYGTMHQIAFFLEWSDNAIDILLETTDGDFNEHFRKIGGSIIEINDDKFIDVVAGNLFPLCGNYYSYIYKASITGIALKRRQRKARANID